jgi:hypothetical protein
MTGKEQPDGYPEIGYCDECGAMMSSLESMRTGLCDICRGTE